MQEAADNFEKALVDFTFNKPKIALFSNVTGKMADDAAEIKKNAVLHLTNPVRWTDEEKVLFEYMNSNDDEWELIEPGVGQVLTGLWSKTKYAENYTCKVANSVDSVDAL